MAKARHTADSTHGRGYDHQESVAQDLDAYTYHVGRFATFLEKPAEQATPEDVRSFQLHLVEERKVGWSTFNQAVCGLRFLYRVTLPRPRHVEMIPFGKRPKKLPTVLCTNEVEQLLACVKSLKHRTLLLTLYAAGLRLGEATSLQIPDIDAGPLRLVQSLSRSSWREVMHGPDRPAWYARRWTPRGHDDG
jgi:site-specific recombinase XerD